MLLIHVLEHLPYPDEMVRNIHKLLSPGDIFLCEVPNDFNPLQEVAVAVHGLRPWWIAIPDHLNYFNISTLSSFIAGHGFDILLRTTDFPLEMFLLWEDNYVDNPEIGSMMHSKRCRFENAMRKAGKNELLRNWYAKIAELGLGVKPSFVRESGSKAGLTFVISRAINSRSSGGRLGFTIWFGC